MLNTKSKKGFTLVEIMIVVVIIGLLAAMAVPAFQRVRANAREKAIINNLRIIWGAGQQYIMDKKVASVTTATLLTDEYYDPITPVSGEAYVITIKEDTANIVPSTMPTDPKITQANLKYPQ